MYIAIGLDLDGRKDVLGMWVGENESAKFWATVLNGLRNRGVEDIFIACTDNLTGFDTAIHAVFPETEIQNCMIHQLRNSSKYDYKNKATDNSRNGHSSKNLRTSFGDVEVSVPRDRKGEFEPQLLKKNQTSISQDIEEKILSMYAKGMTTGDIEAHIQDIYGLAVSDTTVSRITDKILPVAKEWQQRLLESIYAVVFLDAIHYNVRSEGGRS